MSTEEKKFLDQAGLKQAFQLIKKNIKENYVAKEEGKGLSANDFTDALKAKLEGIENSDGQANVIETVKVNDVALTVTDKAVNITSADVVTSDAIAAALGFTPVSASEVAAINTLQYEVVAALPEIINVTAQSDDATKAAAKKQRETIFLVPASRTDVESVANNVYVEYFIVNGAWEEIGDTQLKLEGYATTEAVATEIATAKTETLTEVENNYVKETELSEKVTEIIDSETITEIITENLNTLTPQEVTAIFEGIMEGKPLMTKADGTMLVADTIEEALTSAEAGDKVTLNQDVTLTAPIEVADGVVIDLNGYTLEA